MAANKGGGNKAFWPVIGFVLAVALGLISYILSPLVIKYVVPQLNNGQLSYDNLVLVVAGVVFLILGAIVVLIIAAAVPKNRNPMDKINEKELLDERKVRNRRRLIRKQRELEMKKKSRKRQ
jgi:membrane protein implicated in regulation of membrane protease activity